VKRIFIFAFFALLIPHGAQAADYDGSPLYPPELYELRPSLEIDVGVRYWYSTGKTQMRLFDSTGSIPVSRLTWDDQTGHSGEGYFNIRQSDYFLKGYIGAGVLTSGKLKDEDFPLLPGFPTYSSTNGSSKDGDLRYLSIDFGYYLLNSSSAKLGGFVGYHYDSEKMNAYGCTQTAGNPDVCVPSISGSVKVITQSYRWSSVRLGIAGEVELLPNLKLSGDAAWLPYTSLRGSDTHWLRLGSGPTDFTGATPQTGSGTGMQFEGIATYMFTNNVTLGVGGRYWRMEAPNAKAHFEDSTLNGGPQVEKVKMDRYGVFVQLGVKY
jgi:outer membrane protease